MPWFRRYFPQASLTCVDVSERSLAVGASRFPGQAQFVPFDGRTLPLADGQVDLAFAACVFITSTRASSPPLPRTAARPGSRRRARRVRTQSTEPVDGVRRQQVPVDETQGSSSRGHSATGCATPVSRRQRCSLRVLSRAAARIACRRTAASLVPGRSAVCGLRPGRRACLTSPRSATSWWVSPTR